MYVHTHVAIYTDIHIFSSLLPHKGLNADKTKKERKTKSTTAVFELTA